MEIYGLLDSFPFWGLFLVSIAVILVAVEGGYLFGTYQRRQSTQEKESSVGAMVGATLSLLSFMLAFTFGLAASRFDARRQIVLEEANAIGTAYLRADVLPEPQRTEVRQLFRQYVDVRMESFQPKNIEQAIPKLEELNLQIWKQGVVVGNKDPRSVTAGLFINAMNHVIDLHAKRLLVTLRSRIPGIIWLTLYCITIVAMGGLGYRTGLNESSRSLAIVALVLAFSAVMYLIADLDRPREGLLKANQQAMIDVRTMMNTSEHESLETAVVP